jgi:hypothetical protein
MRKRALENYLESDSIFEVSGVRITFSDQEDVAEKLARAMHQEHQPQCPWEQLPARSRKRRRDKIKRLLNNSAVERMTPERLARSDPNGEIRSWLETIARLAAGSS